jgi:hypothetical protein
MFDLRSQSERARHRLLMPAKQPRLHRCHRLDPLNRCKQTYSHRPLTFPTLGIMGKVFSLALRQEAPSPSLSGLCSGVNLFFVNYIQ